MNWLVKRNNKKGVMGIIFLFIILFSILVLAFIASLVIPIIDFSSDTITPIMEEVGVVGDTNVSEAATYTFGVTDSLVQALPWLAVFAYALALIFSIVFVLSYNYNPNPAFIGLYVAFILLLILASIILSNAYEDIYSGTDEIATRLQENTALSFMIIYSPGIFAAIAFITGIYLFSGRQAEVVSV